jgi:hypothetical protein
MAGLFDPSMFPNAMGSNAPQMGLLARLQQMINQPTGLGGFPGAPAPQQPGADAMAQGGLIPPPQAQPAPQPGPPMPQQPQGAPGGGGFMGALSGFLGNHSNALMGLGAGIASGGLQRGVGGMAAGGQQDYQRMMQQNSLAGTYQALVQAGLPEGLAKAATLNPELLKTIAPEYFSSPKVVQTGESPLGKTFQLQSAGGKFSDIPGGSGGGAGGTGGGMTLLAPGVKQMDPSLQGDAYLQQFSPEVQSAAKAYINGDVLPTGNPRQQGLSNFAKTIAQKWGQDTGQPVSDITYAQKRKMQVDLASSGNSSMGGILANGKSAFAHLADTSDKLADLGNASHDFPAGGYVAWAQNSIGNKLGGSDTQAKLAAANDALGHYGQESTKFYAGTGGGVEERQAAMRNANPTSTSGAEQAAYLSTEKGLMLDRLQQKENQIRDTMGDQYLQQHPVMTPELQGTIGRIDANIAKLRGAPAATGATQATGLPAGWSVQVK